jgi:CRISPR/Cas system-associated exonuclease Cas4 (RecB family)
MAGIWMSFSSFKKFRDCPKHYEYYKIKKVDPPVEDSKHNAIVGSVVQRVFEAFYNEEIWRKGRKTSEELYKRSELYYKEYLSQNYVNFNDPRCRFANSSEPLVEIQEILPKVLQGIKREKLYGEYAKSEIKLQVRFGLEDFLFGYVDFIIKKDEDDIWILDGKASKYREKNVHVEQLYFYALMFYLQYRKMPSRLGFYYYRFADDPEQAFDWIDVDVAKIKALKTELEDVIYAIKKRQFQANPQPSHCRWCPWESVCSERLSQKAQRKRVRAAKKGEKSLIPSGDKPQKIGF